jgi:DNA-binding response OmpR family regulator
MLTGPTLVDNVEYARDSGVSEVLKKPITAKVLCDRIIACVESPRSFITAPTYKGPDRRRRNLPTAEDRRKIDIKIIKYDG